ncbi:RING-H2 finger protein ATL30 [Acorus gramineus]|uniref:RING-H2 finger protein ATL30 n=1 Tax=Acorus gramineus TaxID=55184 RepID=A0AAV9ADS8_ACOGR|nr:RING-H2 finger protein ATL30 [Acorus gramineus]
MRLQMFAGAISAATIAVIYPLFPDMVSLSDSIIFPLILWTMGAVFMWYLFLSLFIIGSSQQEVEMLIEGFGRESFNIICNVILFKKFFAIQNLRMAFALYLVKILGLLGQKRTEHIQMRSNISLLSHIMNIGLLVLLLVVDALLFSQAKHLIDTWQVSVSLYFSLEYMISVIMTGAILLKYFFYVIDMRVEANWARKLVNLDYTFHLDFIRDVLFLSMNFCFLLSIYVGLDIRLSLILADKHWEIFCNLKTCVNDFVRRWKITSTYERYPDATSQELNANDDKCGICYEDMYTAKKLKCRHLFHFQCLLQWLMEREHASCPICRSSIAPPENEPHKSKG